jgi:hypothetical protein
MDMRTAGSSSWTTIDQCRCTTHDVFVANEHEVHENERKIEHRHGSIFFCSRLTSTVVRALSTTNESIFEQIQWHANGRLGISWTSTYVRLPRTYSLKIYDETRQHLIFQRIMTHRQRSIELDVIDAYYRLTMNYTVCLHIRREQYCRSIHADTNQHRRRATTNPSDHFIYFLVACLIAALAICSLLLISCFRRLNSTLSTVECERKRARQTFAYYPLNFLHCPSATSNHTSECSLHSTVDIHPTTIDPYHVYQQISSANRCQLHATIRTPMSI